MRCDEPLISVVIPSLGQRRELVDSIRSALSQDDPNYEALVVLNGVKGDEAKSLRTRFGEDSRLGVIACDEQVDMAANYRRAYELAAGVLIKFLADDDLLLPGCLSTFRKAMTRYPLASIASSTAQMVSTDGVVWGTDLGYGKEEMSYFKPEEAGPALLMERVPMGTPTHVMVRRRPDLNVEKMFASTNGSAFDTGLNFECASVGGMIKVNQALVAVRRHASQASASIDELVLFGNCQRIKSGALDYPNLRGLGLLPTDLLAGNALQYGLISLQNRRLKNFMRLMSVMLCAPATLNALRYGGALAWSLQGRAYQRLKHKIRFGGIISTL